MLTLGIFLRKFSLQNARSQNIYFLAIRQAILVKVIILPTSLLSSTWLLQKMSSTWIAVCSSGYIHHPVSVLTLHSGSLLAVKKLVVQMRHCLFVCSRVFIWFSGFCLANSLQPTQSHFGMCDMTYHAYHVSLKGWLTHCSFRWFAFCVLMFLAWR